MGNELKLTIEQTQRLQLTPGLIQAIKILQLNNQDLNEYISKELLENPLLEVEEQVYTYHSTSSGDKSEEFSFENIGVYSESLSEHLSNQVSMLNIEPVDKEYAGIIIGYLDNNGYLTSELEDIAAELGMDENQLTKLKEALVIVQGLDPAGIGGRDLAECLTIQLRMMDELDHDIEAMLSNGLDDLASGNFQKLSSKYGISKEKAIRILELIKTLNPKPGRKYGQSNDIHYIIPDLILKEDNSEYRAIIRKGTIPELRVSSYAADLNELRKEDTELDSYLKERLNSALWLIKSIRQRQETISKIANAIIHYQSDFFEKGEKFLKPLTMKQIADELNVHESTVSRTVSEKYIQTKRGVIELKYFFTSGIRSHDGELSSRSVKAWIKEIVSREDRERPYSDNGIMEILSGKGIIVSRRTVAKYREAMGIPASSKRRIMK